MVRRVVTKKGTTPRSPAVGFHPKEDLTANAALESARAKAELLKRGLVLPPRPAYDVPTLPGELTDLDDPSLMELFVQLTHWENYLGGQLAEAEIDERTAEHNLEIAEASALVLSWGNRAAKEDSVTVAKAQRDYDPAVVEARAELLKIYARRKLVAVIYNSADKDAAVVSRELTRRVGRAERDNRELKWRP